MSSQAEGSSGGHRGAAGHAGSCITCKKPVQPRNENPAFPFCSARCRQVDLGKWLGEAYTIPDSAPSAEALMDAKNLGAKKR